MCVLDHQKASEALHDLSFKIKRLSFLPEMNLHNICSFQELMTKFCDHYGELRNIQAFCYVFPCDFARKHNEVDIFGTGGSILDGMKSLLMKLPGLKKVELIDLQLDVVDGMYSSFFFDILKAFKLSVFQAGCHRFVNDYAKILQYLHDKYHQRLSKVASMVFVP